jgi:hypothetical protein
MGRLCHDSLSRCGTAALALLALAGGLWRWGRGSRETLIEFRQQRLKTFHQGGTTEQHGYLVSHGSVCKLPTQTLQLRQQAGVL